MEAIANQMKDRLLSLVREQPKHWQFAIKRNAELLDWINHATVDMADDTPIMLRAYCAATDERPACGLGNTRKLKSFAQGFGFCGKTGVCACAKASVAKSVATTKSKDTDEKRTAIQVQREHTNLARYGTKNTGQTIEAKAAHAEFYAQQDNIKLQLQRHASTMQQKYGVSNPAQVPTISQKKQQTLMERYGVGNPMQHRSFAQRSLATRLSNGYAEDYYLANYNRLAGRLHDEYGMRLLTPFADYEGVAGRPAVELACVSCAASVTWRIDYGNHPRCLLCHPRDIQYKSNEELSLLSFIRDDLQISNVISGDRQLITPYELDILLPEQRIAIEYCGLYWHAERQRPQKNYHLNKLRAVERQGYRLYTVFSDEWLDKPCIIKSKLAHILGRSSQRLYARKLQIDHLTGKDALAFYEASHIQGGCSAWRHIGLRDGDRIVAAMSFAQARASRRLDISRSYEMVRFAILPGFQVVGGASRLFRHFIRQTQAEAVLSYADRRWSEGEIYHKLGFVLEATSRPDYAYVENYRHRHFRFGFRKDVLKSVLGEFEQTEWEVMQGLGYDRIWDCGKHRFVWYASGTAA